MKRIVLLLILLQINFTVALADGELIKMFQDSYVTNYVSGRCGDNIRGLVSRADAKRLNLNQANVLIIENKGFTLMGMINVEHARGSRRHGEPGPTNWFHHVVLEKDGLIYDFDFGSSPSVVSVKKYFEKMFLSDKKGEGSTIDYVNPESKLQDYEVEIINSIDIINAQRNRVATPEGKKMRLRQYLNY